jgi:hypothetical protein
LEKSGHPEGGHNFVRSQLRRVLVFAAGGARKQREQLATVLPLEHAVGHVLGHLVGSRLFGQADAGTVIRMPRPNHRTALAGVNELVALVKITVSLQDVLQRPPCVFFPLDGSDEEAGASAADSSPQ